MHGVDSLARRRPHHLLIVGCVPPVEPLGGKLEGVAVGVLVQLARRAPDPLSNEGGVVVARGYWYHGHVVAKGDPALGPRFLG